MDNRILSTSEFSGIPRDYLFIPHTVDTISDHYRTVSYRPTYYFSNIVPSRYGTVLTPRTVSLCWKRFQKVQSRVKRVVATRVSCLQIEQLSHQITAILSAQIEEMAMDQNIPDGSPLRLSPTWSTSSKSTWISHTCSCHPVLTLCSKSSHWFSFQRNRTDRNFIVWAQWMNSPLPRGWLLPFRYYTIRFDSTKPPCYLFNSAVVRLDLSPKTCRALGVNPAEVCLFSPKQIQNNAILFLHLPTNIHNKYVMVEDLFLVWIVLQLE